MLVMVLLVFVAHMFGGRPIVETLLFAVALAVGLSPELLPAILSVSLARGAEMMARHGVLVRRLDAIENLGSMDVLCTDKTGTLTEGVVRLEAGYDAAGGPRSAVVELGAINAALETGLASPLDDAILAECKPDLSELRKLAEIPFDFVRKRVSVVVERDGQRGAHQPREHSIRCWMLCTTLANGTELDDCSARGSRAALHGLEQSRHPRPGRRHSVARPARRATAAQDEQGLVFDGFLTFLDRPRTSAAQALAEPRQARRVGEADHRRYTAGRAAHCRAGRHEARARAHGRPAR